MTSSYAVSGSGWFPISLYFSPCSFSAVLRAAGIKDHEQSADQSLNQLCFKCNMERGFYLPKYLNCFLVTVPKIWEFTLLNARGMWYVAWNGDSSFSLTGTSLKSQHTHTLKVGLIRCIPKISLGGSTLLPLHSFPFCLLCPAFWQWGYCSLSEALYTISVWERVSFKKGYSVSLSKQTWGFGS